MSITKRRFFVLATLLLLLAFAVRVIGLDAQSLWYDEGYSVMFVRNDLGHVLTQAGALELNTPLYYFVLFIWTRLAGESEFSVRLVSVFAGLLTVALAASLGSLRAQRTAGLWALGLMALWPAHVAASQEARMYALVTMLALASFVVVLTRCMRSTGRAVHWAAWAVLCLAAFSAHVLASFIIAGQVVLVMIWGIKVLRQRPRPVMLSTFKAPLVALVSIALLTGAWTLWLLSFRSAYGTSFSDPLNVFTTLAHSLASLILPRNLPASWIPYATTFAAGVMLSATTLSLKARPVMAVGLLSLIGIAVFCAITGKYAARYSAVVAPFWVAGLGIALVPMAQSYVRWSTGIGAVCLVFTALGVWAWRTDPIYANEDYRGAAAFLRRTVAPTEQVVLVSGHFAPVFAYYYGDAGWIALPDDPVLDVRHVLDYERAAPVLNQKLAGASGAWLLEWQSDVIDPTHIVAELLRRQAQGRAYTEHAPAFHNLRLRYFRFAQPYQQTPVPVPLQSRVNTGGSESRGLGAVGCHVFNPLHVGDRALEIACFWTLARFADLPPDTRVSLRLVNPTGEWLVQSDQYLAAPYAVPNAPIGRSLAAFYVIDLPSDLSAGRYQLHVVPYVLLASNQTLEIAPQIYTSILVQQGE
ncbi:MAG: glycosyltransferase family 39 protein [Anaerolineae bacterium]|nr:glycosyltransferase family 39 protein [Thermoflexales bacterium]MDW8407271.1 glycosyltransferase family 39 protein [Anaerolineae bacterium]